MQFHTRDWLDNKELRRCSPAARSVLADLMCLAHEGEPYGHLSDKIGPLSDEFMASRCVVSVAAFRKYLCELVRHERIVYDGTVYLIARMVRDESIRLSRAAGGIKSINSPNTFKPKVSEEGYPYTDPSLSNEGDHLSRVRTDARSESGNGSVFSSVSEKENKFVELEELEVAWERHRKNSGRETQQLVFQRIIGMNGKFNLDRFRERHGQYCEYWAAHGWQFCPLTFLGWVENGMPEPPPEPGKTKSSSDRVIEALNERFGDK